MMGISVKTCFLPGRHVRLERGAVLLLANAWLTCAGPDLDDMSSLGRNWADFAPAMRNVCVDGEYRISVVGMQGDS